ncbi:Uncharacterised protein [Mycobacteroides abscessus subsp. abscessus]|nr:Uncharacterised protein [Mycobacteroides abscessus subsp. abscessus]
MRSFSRLSASSATRLHPGTAWNFRPSANTAIFGMSGSAVCSSKSGLTNPTETCGRSDHFRDLAPCIVMVADGP